MGKAVCNFWSSAPEDRLRAAALGVAAGIPPDGVFVVHLLIHLVNARDEFAQHAQMRVAVVHFFVENDAVETLARRFGQKFFGQRDMFLAGKTEAVNDFADLVFRRFNALGNLDLLLARSATPPVPSA